LLPDQQVYFCGFQQNPYQYYPQASLFLFPSIYEGLPNAPIEALICGLPCILSDCVSGPREILFPDSLDDKVSRTAEVSRYGVLLPAFNGSELFDTRELIPEETLWVQEICKALSNPQQLEEWKTASQEIRTKYDANRVIGLWKAHCR
ncbi:MAG TPA: glycosyltransferase, partial [Chitinophagaceae bacterium]|nr:glycosyltransferase [Chitinophagaceae bacterium]